MPNGDHRELIIDGIEVIALPDEIKIPVKKVGAKENKKIYSLDLKDIPTDKRYLTLGVKTHWF